MRSMASRRHSRQREAAQTMSSAHYVSQRRETIQRSPTNESYTHAQAGMLALHTNACAANYRIPSNYTMLLEGIGSGHRQLIAVTCIAEHA